MKLMGRQRHRCQFDDDRAMGEHEDSQAVIDRSCPKGGPDCLCDKAD